MRFFAFVAVLLDHFPIPVRSHFHLLSDVGAFGLPLFFMLSAYLIVTLLLRERENTGTISVKSFFVRRVLRIWPLYFIAISLDLLIGAFWSPARLTPSALLSMLLLTTNLYILKFGWALGLISPLWSIAIEEQFYLAVPWLGRALPRRMLWIFFGAVLVMAYAVLWRLGQQNAGLLTRVWPNSFVQFQFFAVGGLIALAGREMGRAPVLRFASLMGGVGLWMVAQSRFHLHAWSSSISGRSLCAGYACLLLGTALLFFSFLGTTARIPRQITSLGVISYGLYVYHQFWIVFFFFGLQLQVHHNWVAAMAALTCTIATAHLSYRYFEQPILSLKRRFEIVRTGITA